MHMAETAVVSACIGDPVKERRKMDGKENSLEPRGPEQPNVSDDGMWLTVRKCKRYS